MSELARTLAQRVVCAPPRATWTAAAPTTARRARWPSCSSRGEWTWRGGGRTAQDSLTSPGPVCPDATPDNEWLASSPAAGRHARGLHADKILLASFGLGRLGAKPQEQSAESDSSPESSMEAVIGSSAAAAASRSLRTALALAARRRESLTPVADAREAAWASARSWRRACEGEAHQPTQSVQFSSVYQLRSPYTASRHRVVRTACSTRLGLPRDSRAQCARARRPLCVAPRGILVHTAHVTRLLQRAYTPIVVESPPRCAWPAGDAQPPRRPLSYMRVKLLPPSRRAAGSRLS